MEFGLTGSKRDIDNTKKPVAVEHETDESMEVERKPSSEQKKNRNEDLLKTKSAR